MRLQYYRCSKCSKLGKNKRHHKKKEKQDGKKVYRFWNI